MERVAKAQTTKRSFLSDVDLPFFSFSFWCSNFWGGGRWAGTKSKLLPILFKGFLYQDKKYDLSGKDKYCSQALQATSRPMLWFQLFLLV